MRQFFSIIFAIFVAWCSATELNCGGSEHGAGCTVKIPIHETDNSRLYVETRGNTDYNRVRPNYGGIGYEIRW